MFHVSHLQNPPLSDVDRRAVALVGLGFGVTAGDRAGRDRQAQAQNQLLQHGNNLLLRRARPGEPCCNRGPAKHSMPKSVAFATVGFVLTAWSSRLVLTASLLRLHPRVLDAQAAGLLAV